MKIHNLKNSNPHMCRHSVHLPSQLRTAPSLSDWPTVLRPLLGNLLRRAEPAFNGLYWGEFDQTELGASAAGRDLKVERTVSVV